MNKSGWLATVLTLGGVLESVTGLALLAVPSSVASLLLRARLEGAALLVARLAGGGLLSLGIACWFARGTPLAPAAIGVAWAFTAYNVVACGVLLRGGPPVKDGGLPALGAGVLHGAGAVILLAVLL